MKFIEKAEGFVYLVGAYHMSPCGFFKIGVTQQESFRGRIKQIQSSSPFNILPIKVVKHTDCYWLESEILERFKEYRIRGEWFSVASHYCFGSRYNSNIVSASTDFQKNVSDFMVNQCDLGVAA